MALVSVLFQWSLMVSPLYLGGEVFLVLAVSGLFWYELEREGKFSSSETQDGTAHYC